MFSWKETFEANDLCAYVYLHVCSCVCLLCVCVCVHTFLHVYEHCALCACTWKSEGILRFSSFRHRLPCVLGSLSYWPGLSRQTRLTNKWAPGVLLVPLSPELELEICLCPAFSHGFWGLHTCKASTLPDELSPRPWVKVLYTSHWSPGTAT